MALKPYLAASLVALATASLAGPTFAQSNEAAPPAITAPLTSPVVPGAAPPRLAELQPMDNPLAAGDADKIKGISVIGQDDKKIGKVEDVVMSNGKVDQLVLESGGFLGIGARSVALPADQFAWDGDKAVFRISKSKEDLKALPEYKARG